MHDVHASLRRRPATAVAVALAVPATASAGEVTKWNGIATSTLVLFPGPAGGAPPALQINMAMTQGAVYDAVNATEPKHHRPYLVKRRVGATASKDAAVATAAHRVLSYIVSTVPATIAFPNRGSLSESLDTAYATSLAAIPDSPFKRQEIVAGNAAADAMIAARQGDGRFGSSQWVPNSAVRTPEQTHNALFWQTAGGPALLWNSVARNLVDDPTYAVDVADSARLLAMLNLAGADTAINCWNDKYHYDFWRPWQAIRETVSDGNPATVPDPSWTPLLTAPYPEHPSGHLCLDGAELRVLQMFFGTDEVGFDVTSSRFPGEPRHFDRFSEPLEEIIDARIWAGLHFRTADNQAHVLGENVVDYMAAHYFQPVGRH